jgi:two-component system sensor histidine kinase UhpB
MSSDRRSARRKYVPLFYRVAALNGVLLVTAVVVTILILEPGKFSSFAADESIVLVVALGLVVVLNLIVLRRVLRPLEAVTALARRVDLSRPGERMPGATPSSEAGELAITFNEMLARLEAERREATGRVLAGQEAERLRIAQELHDQVGQELTAVLLGLARVQSQVDPALHDDVTVVQDGVRSSLEDVRRISLELRPEALDDLGLVSALAVLCERFARGSGVTVAQSIDEHLPDLDPETELVIYRVAQEALTNVARHSGSRHAELSLRSGTEGLVMTVSDRGSGFHDNGQAGAGIRGMRERAALIGARLAVGTNADGGCTVVLSIAGDSEAARV